MNPDEYQNLERLENVHWFYQGKREIVRHWIDRYRPLGSDDLLIDAGMGTGTWLVEMARSRGCQVIGLDDYEESLAIARPRLEAIGGRAIQTPLDRVDLPDALASVVTALDVLEHLDDDASALSELIRLTKPGGLIVLTVPALRWLWSDWDVVLHHRRRYHQADLLRLVQRPEVEVLRCAYFNSAVLPLIAGVRLWRKLVPPRPGAARAEDRVPSPIVNEWLRRTFVGPARWPWFHPPAGSSLLAVLRRRNSTPIVSSGLSRPTPEGAPSETR
jgi:ubiquinone/menaquinone biosynthesis C-methylase UbiE